MEGLELPRDARYRRIGWKLQRVGWVGMALFVLAAVMGLLGAGPFSGRVAGVEGSSLWVDYQRFSRMTSPQDLRIHVGPGQAHEGKLVLWLGRELVDNYDVTMVMPQPEAMEVRGDRVDYVFNAPVAGDEIALELKVESEGWGARRGRIGIAGGPTVAIEQIVYP